MENKLIISVIIPVYNGEHFIDRCLSSLLCQMHGQIEVILINDGSTDNSGTILNSFAENYKNIHVVHKENGGTSSAKNAGIDIAKGAYISFLDVDDYIDYDAYNEIEEVIMKYHPDCIDFGWKYIGRNGDVTSNHHAVEKNRVLSREEIERIILPPLLNLCKNDAYFVFDFACTKIFRADIIKDYGLYFDVGRRTWEDRPFVLRCLKHCETYYSMEQCFYNYVDIPNSLSRRYDINFFNIILETFREYNYLFGDKFDFDTQYANDYWCHAIENMIYRSLRESFFSEQIKLNILRTLQDPQVLHWYSKRVPKNSFEKKMSNYVINGKPHNALLNYGRAVKHQQNSQLIAKWKYKAKHIIKRL